MKVKGLIEILQQLNPESEVVVARDEEGNGFQPAYCITEGVFIAEDAQYYDSEWTADDCCLEPEEWEAMKNGPDHCIVIWP